MSERFQILIVEDEKLAGKVLSNNLKEKGYGVTHCQTGEEALLYFSRDIVDLVLLDYRLPGMSGEELFGKLKEINPLVPVIFMTAYS